VLSQRKSLMQYLYRTDRWGPCVQQQHPSRKACRDTSPPQSCAELGSIGQGIAAKRVCLTGLQQLRCGRTCVTCTAFTVLQLVVQRVVGCGLVSWAQLCNSSQRAQGVVLCMCSCIIMCSCISRTWHAKHVQA
jgi:hypothetical protein